MKAAAMLVAQRMYSKFASESVPRLATQLIHADNINNRVTDVAPPINVSTTYRYDNNELVAWTERSGANDLDFWNQTPIYSRLSHPNSVRLETVFSKILQGHSVVYSSGLAAFFAALMFYHPKNLFIDQCYHGCHGIANILARNGYANKRSHNEIESMAEPGDIVHLETPVNPYGTSYNISEFAKKAHDKGALLMVDSTFAPPPLQYCWDFGADIIMHSATKYFGGHSDLLSGVLTVKDEKTSQLLKEDRIYLGTNVANLESFMLLRSLRTFEMRITKQSKNATDLVAFLASNKDTKFNKVIENITHFSLQKESDFVKKQLIGGYNPVFSLSLKKSEQCKKLTKKLRYFQHATSLGGIESLVEWRALTDPYIDQNLIRVSTGCEDIDDLIADLDRALTELQNEIEP